MSTVKWLVVRCRMYLFRLPDYPIPIDQVAIWRFGNRTKYIRHRTTSHLTANICDWPVTSTYGTCSDLPAGERYDYYYGSAVDRRRESYDRQCLWSFCRSWDCRSASGR